MYLIGLFLGLLLFSVGCAKMPNNNTVIKVGTVSVHTQDFSDRLLTAAKEMSPLALSNPKKLRLLKKQIVDDIVVENLLELWAQKENLTADLPEASELLSQSTKDYPDNDAVRETMGHLPVSKKILSQRLRSGALRSLLMGRLSVTPRVDRKKIEAQYWSDKTSFRAPARIKIQQILVKTALDAELIGQALKKGSGFGDLAKQYSVAPEASESGVVGWIEKGVSDTFDAAFTFPIKKASRPIESSYGFHIIRVLGREKQRKLPLETVIERFRAKSEFSLKKRMYEKWLEDQLLQNKVLVKEKIISSLTIELIGKLQ